MPRSYETDRDMRDGLEEQTAEAVRAAVDRFSPIIEMVVGSVLTNPLDVEEVVQDTFMKVIKSIATYDPDRCKLSTWMCKIAYRSALSHLRRQPKIKTERLDEMTREPSSQGAVETDSRVEMLQAALERLEPPERALLQMVYDASMPLGEVAEILDTNAGALSARLYRLRGKLAKIMNKMSKHQYE